MEKKNIIAFVVKESVYAAVAPILWGTMMQQFLLYRGASAAMIGIYSTVVPFAQTAAMILLSGAMEQVQKPLRFSTGMTVLTTVLAVACLPVMYWDLGNCWTVVLACALSLAYISLYSGKSICDFRGNYQIVSPKRYGTMIFHACAATGVAGVGFGWLFSLFVDQNTGGNPYFSCMLVTCLLLAAATVSNSLLTPICSLSKPQRRASSLWEQAGMLRKNRSFRWLMIPNMLRGVTMSVTGCVVMFALVMGMDESGRAKIPMVCALATVLASALYMLLSRKLPTAIINLVGGGLTCALLFLPRGNTYGFLVLYFVAYLGQTLVDNTIPVLLYPIIEPQIAGIYNAWRCALHTFCCIVAAPVVCALVEKVNPTWLLACGGLSYLTVTVWYYVVCRKLQVSQNVSVRKRRDRL